MNQFTIRDIENLSGIKAHTLRIWEQRYSLMTPKRKESNHRFYDSSDLKQILRISYLYHSGVKISRIAAMGEKTMNELLSKTPTGNSNEYLLKELMEASIDFDEHRFEKGLNQLFSNEDLERSILEVIYPYLRKIGMLWLTDHIIPAQEHFSSNIIIRKLLMAIDQLPQTDDNSGRETILFTPEREHHEISLLFIWFLLKKSGTKVIYMGCNTPKNIISEYLQVKTAARLHFHLITNLNNADPSSYLQELADSFPAQQIIASGPSCVKIKTLPANARVLRSIDEIIEYCKE